MKHIKGNNPQCWECKYYTETPLDLFDSAKLPQGATGWCLNKKYLRVGVNGHIRKNPPKKAAVRWNNTCKYWIDAESGHTRFQVLTGHNEDGTPVDWEVQR